MKNMPLKFCTTLLFVALTATLGAFADEPAKPAPAKTQPQEEILNNAAIIELAALGLGENLIVDKIKTSRCDFDVTLAGLKQLKAAKVPEAVIGAMIGAKPGTQAASSTSADQPSDANDPNAPHEAGIWLRQDEKGQVKMVQLEPSGYSQRKSGVGFFMQFGQTVKNSAVVASSHASIVTTNRRPTFYFYFDRSQGGRLNGATSANEYILAQFDVLEKDNQRRLVTGSTSMYTGGASGSEGKSVRSFSFEKLSPGVYKVTPKEDLGNGEYGFYYGGSTGGGSVYDFGINGSAETEPTPPVVDAKKDTPKKNSFK